MFSIVFSLGKGLQQGTAIALIGFICISTMETMNTYILHIYFATSVALRRSDLRSTTMTPKLLIVVTMFLINHYELSKHYHQ